MKTQKRDGHAGESRQASPATRDLIGELGQLIAAKDAEIARLRELWSAASYFVRGCLEALGLPEPAMEGDGTLPCNLEDLRLQIIGVIEGLKGEVLERDAELAKRPPAQSTEQYCMHGRAVCEPCAQMAIRKALAPEAAVSEEGLDSARLDFLEGECVELRCKESRNHDDADVYYEAVKFFMSAPREKVVGVGSSPREAIDAARRNEADKCAYCEDEGCLLCQPKARGSEQSVGHE